jgi:ribosome-binding protein aMBF1 (putative translation factor)
MDRLSARPGRAGRVWAYVGAGSGAGVSVAANVAHSYVPPAGAAAGWSPHPGAVVGAVFWPLGLLVAIEILARVRWPAGGRWVAVRFGGLLPVALVAAVVSYRHLSGLLAFYGEDTITARVGPVAVDGLMVMATGALLATSSAAAGLDAAGREASGGARVDASMPATRDASRPARGDMSAGSAVTRRTWPAATTDQTSAPANATRRTRPSTTTGQAAGQTAADTAGRVAAARSAHPGWSRDQVAAWLGVSTRTVRRYWTTTDNTTTAGAAGELTGPVATSTAGVQTDDELEVSA